MELKKKKSKHLRHLDLCAPLNFIEVMPDFSSLRSDLGLYIQSIPLSRKSIRGFCEVFGATERVWQIIGGKTQRTVGIQWELNKG